MDGAGGGFVISILTQTFWTLSLGRVINPILHERTFRAGAIQTEACD